MEPQGLEGANSEEEEERQNARDAREAKGARKSETNPHFSQAESLKDHSLGQVKRPQGANDAPRLAHRKQQALKARKATSPNATISQKVVRNAGWRQYGSLNPRATFFRPERPTFFRPEGPTL